MTFNWVALTGEYYCRRQRDLILKWLGLLLLGVVGAITLVAVLIDAGMKQKWAERARKRSAHLAEMAEQMTVPPLPDGARLSFVSTNQGRAISSISIGDEDTVVTAVRLDIEAGTQPLFIIATSDRPKVWLVSGHTGRVAHFVVAPTNHGEPLARAGVVGLPPERVVFIESPKDPEGDAIHFFSRLGLIDDRTIQNAREEVRILLGREPDIIVAHHELALVKLPAGELHENHAYEDTIVFSDSEATRAILRGAHHPVAVEIDPQTVVSPWPVRRHDLLPGVFGLVQLVSQGVLEVSDYQLSFSIGVTSDTSVRTFSPSAEEIEAAKVPSAYRIIGKMRFPPGTLHETFVVAAGQTAPHNRPWNNPLGIDHMRDHRVTCETTGLPLQPGEFCPITK